MKKIGIFYGSSSGNTEKIAKTIAKKLNADLYDIAAKPANEIQQYQNLVLGTSTWGIGDLQDDWDSFLPQLAQADLTGKTVALFGLGDSVSYSDTFVDGMGIIFETIRDKGCRLVGETPSGDYRFESSKAIFQDNFVGLPLDLDNEDRETGNRIEKWLAAILPEFQ